MKKWLLALMICLSFSTLTVGLSLVPEVASVISQRQEEQQDGKEEDSPARQMAGPKYIKISQRLVNSYSGVKINKSGKSVLPLFSCYFCGGLIYLFC